MQNRNKIITTILLALGFFALPQTAQSVSPAPDGGYAGGNTAEGQNALFSLTTGGYNTGNGWNSLHTLSSGSFNTGIGAATLFANTGDQNTAAGAAALLGNTTGTNNTANGAFALLSNTTGLHDTADGEEALFSNTTGNFNVAVGRSALRLNTIGNSNAATGNSALGNNTTGHDNTANGFKALFSNTTGALNTALGNAAGTAATTGDGNVYIGAGMIGVAGESNHTYIKNIKDTAVSGGGTDAVTVDVTTGLLGHLTSSRRYKEDIKPMNSASEALYQLKPVTYCYKKEIDRNQSPAFGLIAEEVAEVNPALVACNSQGQPESVHYEMVNAMLLNEFLNEHRKVQEQEATIAQLKCTVAKQEEGIEALAVHMREQDSKIQRVSDQPELRKSASRVVVNKP